MRSVLACLLLAGLAFGQEAVAPAPSPAPAPAPVEPDASGPGLYAIFDTSLGEIAVRLLEDKAPQTVQNFVALVNGVKPSADITGRHMVKKRFYDHLIFHRVIKGFMIQTGDVTGSGESDCGVTPIPDEVNPMVRFNGPGRLAMANTGRPNTAACQIFITVGAAEHLNGSFTIFGLVSSGQDVADKIADVPTENERPVTPVTLNKITIERRDH